MKKNRGLRGLGMVGKCSSCPSQNKDTFCQLPPKALAELSRIRQTRVYLKGTVLFSRNQPPEGIYVLRSGRAKLTTTSRRGRTVIVRLAEPGEVLGLSAVLSNRPYKASAQILELSEACFIARPDFLRFLQTWKETTLKIGKDLSVEVHCAYENLSRVALFPTAKGKLASLLLDWAAGGTQLTESSVLIPFQLTHEEMGDMIAVRRETITRLMKTFHRKGLIQLTGKSIILPNISNLEALIA